MPSLTPSSSSSTPTQNTSEDSSCSWKLNHVNQPHPHYYSLQSLKLTTLPTNSPSWFSSRRPELQNNESEPFLINLSSGNSQMEYHLQSGVTMLGTGKGCVKPPEIILEGSGVAPQHCFIERINIEDEVILHPISDLTTLDGQKVSGPTPLSQGNLIRVGDNNLLQFNKSTKSATANQRCLENPLKECPYAVIVKQKGTTSNLNSPGDVNKTSSSTMDKSFSSPTQLYNQCHSNNNQFDATRQRHPLWRQDSFEDDYYDNGHNDNDHGSSSGSAQVHRGQTPPQKYRDGLESDNFENKVARFEFLAAHYGHSQTNSNITEFEIHRNGRFQPNPLRPLPTPPPGSNSFPKSMSSSHLENKRRRPSPYFSRFGTNSEFRYFSDESRTSINDSNANYILQSSKAVPTIGYRRTHSVSYASSPNEVIPLIRSNTIDDSRQSAKAFAANQFSQSSNSFSLQSSPSPDSVYSSHSSEGSFLSYGNFRSTPPSDLRNLPRDTKDSPSFVSFEELDCHIGKQASPEERHFSIRSVPVPSYGETSALDEVLAICEEYEQQIAREIEQKHSATQHMTNEEYHKSLNDDCRPTEYFIAKLTPTPSQNGSHREESGSGSHEAPEQTGLLTSYHNQDTKRNEARAQFFSLPEFKTQFSVPSISPTPKIAEIQNSPNCHSLDGNLLRPKLHCPYDNVTVNEQSSWYPRVDITPLGQSADCIDGPRPANLSITQNVQNGGHSMNNSSPTEIPQKSKLSVSFSPSVEEYNMDDYIPRVSSASSSPKSPTELTSRLKSPHNSNNIIKTVATKVQIHASETTSHERVDSSENMSSTALSPILIIQRPCQVVESVPTEDVIQFAEVIGEQCQEKAVVMDSSQQPPVHFISKTEHPISRLKSQIRDLEQQEMEALREMEMEKALLHGEEESIERQLSQSKSQLEEMRNRLCQIDGGIRLWKVASAQELSAMKRKLSSCERNLQRLEKMHEDFCGTTDEETNLLEKLKYQHELIEVERKVFEDAEFQQMEETANKEAQRDELIRLFGETKRKLSIKQIELDQLRNQNRLSLAASVKEIHKLENQRQILISELQESQQSVKTDTLSIPEVSYFSSNSDSDEVSAKNSDLEEKLKSLTLLTAAADDAMTIEMIKSNSPIDPKLGNYGSKTSETLREIEKYREYLLNEQGVQMLEEERQRVKELQKRVQAAVREEWEAARQKRSNQCQSLNSVGSEESSQTISDTPTDSGSSDDGPDKGPSLSFGKTEHSLEGNSNGLEQTSFELCQQMRHRQKDLSQTSSSDDTPRPVSDGSAYDNRPSIVTLREKHSVQNNRPLTRYLPVRGDEDHFDLRGHIESSGHQLSLCPQLVLTSMVAKGSLLKLGSRFHNWNKRWFVFDRETRTFSYYIDKTQKKPRGGIHFQAIQEVYVDHLQSVKSPAPKLTFCVKTYNRVFHLVAPSPEAMRIWVDIIFTGAEGYQEFKPTA